MLHSELARMKINRPGLITTAQRHSPKEQFNSTRTSGSGFTTELATFTQHQLTLRLSC